MKYIIDESEAANFVADILGGEKPKPLLAGKQPVELIASGEVIIKTFDNQESCYIGEGTDISYWIAENHLGKNINIYIEEAEE